MYPLYMIYGSEVKIMPEMRIELMSNLCVSGGNGYASVIDTDVVIDQLGIPFIPARRLKGCLREAAVYIYGENSEIIKRIFGVQGDKKSGALSIENAYIEEYASFSKMCVENGLAASRVTELFTDTYASTAVENTGAAKENSLRFLRYVSKNKAWNTNKNLVFSAEYELDDEYSKDFKRICKALRHIGFKRNRGFGNVKCSVRESVKNKSGLCFTLPSNFADDKDYVITYAVSLDEYLMLSSQSANESLDYISGQAVVGAFADKYLKVYEADKNFDELFLSGKVRFSNLYITDRKYKTYVPVPPIFGKTKQSSQIIDLTVSQRTSEIVKPLKDGYINSDLDVKKPLTERIYHNNLADADGGLYIQNGIQKDQLFMGTVSGKGFYIRIIAGLLKKGKLSFGRSKTAQYSKCSLAAISIEEVSDKKVHLQKGDKAVYLFESDTLIQNEFAGNSVSVDEVCKALDIDEKNLLPESGLKYKTISGYLSVIRMQRPHIRSIAAGSALVVVCGEDITLDEILYIGCRQNEGFGKVRVFKAGELLKSDLHNLKTKDDVPLESHDDIKEMFVLLEKDEKMRNTAVSYALSKKQNFLKDWGTAFIGRVTLMLEQSYSKDDFYKRIASIKANSKRTIADKLIKDALKNWESDPEYKVWSKEKEYLLIILTLAKYFHKEKGNG